MGRYNEPDARNPSERTTMHVLVVEDDARLAEALARILEDNGYATDVVHDGEAGVQYGETGLYDVIILDVMLPKADGFTVAQNLRRAHVSTPILLLTARDAVSDKICGYDSGADDYMTKPFSPGELVARVKAHIERYQRLTASGIPTNDVIEIRGLKIDKTARRVYVNGEEKAFTTKEFDLLTFLAENPNHVFTKEEIFREIWEMESIGDIATVTVHIKKIREKIEDSSSKPQYIETIWGVGYRFKM